MCLKTQSALAALRSVLAALLCEAIDYVNASLRVQRLHGLSRLGSCVRGVLRTSRIAADFGTTRAVGIDGRSRPIVDLNLVRHDGTLAAGR